MRRAWLLVSLLAVLLGACGYHLSGQGPARFAGVQRLAVELLENRTTEPLIEVYLTNALRDEFARRPDYELVDTGDLADAVVQGRVHSYQEGAVAYSPTDAITEYRIALLADVQLMRADGQEILWQGQVSWQEEYRVNPDRAAQDVAERQAQQELCRRLASEIFNRIVDDF
ncbi:LPS assembly lipoprotein LptE [Desulfuromonas thiophila]|uniref:LPS assembly lipoprotein LptE n=1 Tax=Desulfuromonas thiophila TaxID=57664 RepID=UPI0024A88222|nr:LPS assembly lipoprotein LptE [Desulfuromonas thiophila]